MVDADAKPTALSSIAFADRVEVIPGLLRNEPIVIDELDHTVLARAGLAHLSRLNMRSGCLVPLLDGNEAVGALVFSSTNPKAFGLRELRALGDTAAQIATALNNALAFRQIADLVNWRTFSNAP